MKLVQLSGRTQASNGSNPPRGRNPEALRGIARALDALADELERLLGAE